MYIRLGIKKDEENGRKRSKERNWRLRLGKNKGKENGRKKSKEIEELEVDEVREEKGKGEWEEAVRI